MKSKAKGIFHGLTTVGAALVALSTSGLFVFVPTKVAAGVTAASAIVSAVLHFWVQADPTVDDAEAK